MSKKQFTTSIDNEVFNQFKNTCNEYGISMNVILEGLVKDFILHEYEIKITKTGIEIKKI